MPHISNFSFAKSELGRAALAPRAADKPKKFRLLLAYPFFDDFARNLSEF